MRMDTEVRSKREFLGSRQSLDEMFVTDSSNIDQKMTELNRIGPEEAVKRGSFKRKFDDN